MRMELGKEMVVVFVSKRRLYLCNLCLDGVKERKTIIIKKDKISRKSNYRNITLSQYVTNIRILFLLS